jgi:hypothetical protein
VQLHLSTTTPLSAKKSCGKNLTRRARGSSTQPCNPTCGGILCLLLLLEVLEELEELEELLRHTQILTTRDH